MGRLFGFNRLLARVHGLHVPLERRFANGTQGVDEVTSFGAVGSTALQDVDAYPNGNGTIIHFDPDEYGVTKCRITAAAFPVTNDPDKGDLTFALYPVESYSESGIVRGAQVGPSVVVPFPGSNEPASGVSADFDAPPAGDYVLTVYDGGDVWSADIWATLEGAI